MFSDSGDQIKKKTGLVGPAFPASSWMRLHRSTARLVAWCCRWPAKIADRIDD
jgi:hypothetical protein